MIHVGVRWASQTLILSFSVQLARYTFKGYEAYKLDTLGSIGFKFSLIANMMRKLERESMCV